MAIVKGPLQMSGSKQVILRTKGGEIVERSEFEEVEEFKEFEEFERFERFERFEEFRVLRFEFCSINP